MANWPAPGRPRSARPTAASPARSTNCSRRKVDCDWRLLLMLMLRGDRRATWSGAYGFTRRRGGVVSRRQFGGVGQRSDRQHFAFAADFDLVLRVGGKVEPGALDHSLRDDEFAAILLGQLL